MPINTPYSFSLDIVKQTKIPYMQFYQTDVNTSQMSIEITNNDEVVDLTGHTVLCNINKADGTKIQNVVTIEDALKGLLNLSLTTQSLTAIGECKVQLTIFDGTNRKSVHEIKYYVLPSMLNLEVPESVNEYGWLLQLIGEVQEVENILNTSEAERVQAENNRVEAENNRVILKGQLDTLKDDLESLQDTLNTLNTNTTNAEATRNTNEEARQTLKGQLEELQTNLTTLKGQLETLDTNISNNETTRQSQEADRQALKGQLEALQGTLEALENTLNTNDSTRTNTANTKVTEVNDKITEANSVIADIQNRFALLQTSQQQASEVINARTSTTKAKTFASLGARIEETEQNILTSQSTSVVDSVVPFNTLANSLDGATDLTIKGMSLVQLVKNGNFASGTNGWLGVQSTITSTTNTLLITSDGTSSSPFAYQVTTTPITTGRKIYIKAKLKVTNSNATSIKIQITGSTTSGTPYEIIQNAPTINTLYTLQGICTIPSDMVGFVRIRLYHTYADSATANGKVMEVQEVMALDLTSLSLDTKTADEINAMLNGYFEGIASVEGGTSAIKSIGENLLGLDLVTLIGSSGGTGTKITNGINIKNTVSNNWSHTYFTIKLKPNTQYVLKATNVVIRSGLGNISARDINDTPISGAIDGNSANNYTCTFTTPLSGMVRIKFYSTLGTLAIGDVDYTNIQLNEGSVAKPYTPYKESKTILSDFISSQYFPLRSVSPTIYDEAIGNKLYKKISEKTLQASDILGMYTVNANLDYAYFLKPLDSKCYNVYSTKTTILQNFTEDTIGSMNDITNVGKWSTVNSLDRVYVGFTKGTTLAQAQALLTGLKFIYQLTTPQEITLSRPINIPIFKNGTIIQEPSKMYAKLSYSFPTNIGRSVESIVNNLAWIKDNQQFIMSYLLELDTRLTLGGH